MFDQIISTYNFETVLLEKAKGSWVWDTEGKKYLDCVSGTWTCNLGHNHPKIIEAIKQQSEKMLHRNMRFLTPETLEAAKTILEFIPIKMDKITFLNSGSEAMEFAIALARKASKKAKILSLTDSYFGAYGSAREASYTSSKTSKLKIPYPEHKSDTCGQKEEEYNELIEHVIENYSSELACFVLEPIMVSGGIHKPCPKFVKKLCERLQEKGVIIISNEVTTGFGRSGFKFGFQHHQIMPDIIAAGKAIGNGYPVSMIATKNEIQDKIDPADMYYAQSHQLDPLGASVAKTVVNIFDDDNIIEKSKETIQELKEYFDSLDYPFIDETRAIGMLFAIQIKDYKGATAEQIIIKLKDELFKNSVLVGISTGKKIIRLLPPINISQNEIKFLKEKIKIVFNVL
ncbi:MAG: class-III pyridoxal-phosphate-dependent aminotransferase [Candidatus Heimdallarchaeota archaeon]